MIVLICKLAFICPQCPFISALGYQQAIVYIFQVGMAQRHRYLDLDTLNAPCSLIRPRSIEYKNLIPFEKKNNYTNCVFFESVWAKY